jgi:DNA-binding NarL/FixJ family response regulator
MLNLDIGQICKPGDMLRLQIPDVGGPLRWMTGLVASILRAPAEPTGVMVVADQAVFAEALALAIDTAGSSSCVAVADSAAQALRMVATVRPDVVVIDLDGDDDFATVRGLLEAQPALRVLLLTEQSPSPGLVQSAVRAGAAAVFPKTTSLSVVVAALPCLSDHLFTTDRKTITALCESAAQSTAQASAAATSNSNNNHRPSNLLTRRERDILALLDRGIDLPTASDRLGISVNTTRGYVKNLYRKLDVHSQVELLAVARDKGLLEEAPG